MPRNTAAKVAKSRPRRRRAARTTTSQQAMEARAKGDKAFKLIMSPWTLPLTRPRPPPPAAHAERGEHTLPRWDLRRAPLRLAIAAAMGLLAAVLWHTPVRWFVRSVVGWDAGAITMCTLTWLIIARADPSETRRRAARQRPRAARGLADRRRGQPLQPVRRHGGPAPGALLPADREADLWTGLTLGAIALSWVLTHTAYTMRYAHLYYRRNRHDPHCHPGGLKFPEDNAHPCDLDFAYFAFTLGMCFQVSDVSITSWRVRREALLHALLSFVYNTTILALALNLASGLLG